MVRDRKRVPPVNERIHPVECVGRDVEKISLTVITSTAVASNSIGKITKNIVRRTKPFFDEMHKLLGGLLINKPKEDIKPSDIGILITLRSYFSDEKDLIEKIKRKQEEYVSDVPPAPSWFKKQIEEKDKKQNTEKISIEEAEKHIRKYLEFIENSDYEIPEETIKMNIKRDLDRIDEDL